MKRIGKKEKDAIQKWEDIPLSEIELKRLNIDDINKIQRWHHISSIEIELENLQRFKKMVSNAKSKISIQIETDSDHVEETTIWVDDLKNTVKLEDDDGYKERIDYIKKGNWNLLLINRKFEKNFNARKRKNEKYKQDPEYKEFVRLKKKFH